MPEVEHHAHNLWQGLLLLKAHMDETGTGWVCVDCLRALSGDRMPKLALNNNMWLGDAPLVLRKLTFAETLLVARHYPCCYIFKLYPKDGSHGYNPAHLQRGMAGNVTLYEVNTLAIANMVEGSMMPQEVTTLSNVIAITFMGTRTLPKNWMSHTFQARREAVHEALLWLKANNHLYHDITISTQRLMTLPDDEILVEIEAIIWCEDDAAVAVQENEGYVQDSIDDEMETTDEVNEDDIDVAVNSDCGSAGVDDETKDDEADVIPLHALGVMDTDLARVSSSELMMYVLANLMDATQEGGYVVCHSVRPIGDFGKNTIENGTPNPLAAAFLCLFPYGLGGVEAECSINVSLCEHARWAMQYYDRHFVVHHAFPFMIFAMIQKWDAMRSTHLQMQRKDFERDALVLSCLTVVDLRKAEEEEGRKAKISNPRVRALQKHVVAANSKVEGSDNARTQYRGMIWGTCLFLGGPMIWMTINPADVHDLIAQVLAGEAINLDKFDVLGGPDSHQRAINIASNPYAAAKFFNLLIESTLECLLGIKRRLSRTTSEMGILGELSGYFGVVEAQGRGTLHVHMLLWLAGNPDPEEMQQLLQTPAFCEKIREYIWENIRAHLDDITEEDLKMMP
ncbi:hypothetical protein M404DRAFT_21123 [Pisolithus tinctorius Marx 270]|uniref:Uncharacterized protein n=1 Tax=Pisolithus tinctorius Marx 270 TaxID=870435 RepID=A0A0C3PB73_PISTI|nr:hypothetical protein M404DRAFT_21123 [Pisolithus tinctorius Marx 270]